MKRLFTLLLGLALCSFFLTEATAQKKVAFGKGLRYTAPDTSFSVKFNFRMQQLLVVNTVDDNSDATSSQFLVRRSRLKFDGFAFTPKLKYKAELGLTNRDIAINSEDGNTRDAARIILDAVLKYEFVKGWELWVGQTKLPGNRERVISSANLQFVDRSIVNSRFNIDRDAGLQLRGKLKVGEVLLNPTFAVTMGEGRNITSNNAGGYNYTAHLDFLPFGSFAGKGDYIGSDLEREPEPKLSIGLTYNYNDGAVRQQGQLGRFVENKNGVDGDYVENNLTAFIADLMFKYQGFSVMSEYANTTGDNESTELSSGFNTGSGISVQAGYLLPSNWEIALRYTSIERDEDFSGITDENQFTFGISKYIVGHALKVQTDFTRRTFPLFEDTPGRSMFRMQMEMQF
jgi:hypothetical protein